MSLRSFVAAVLTAAICSLPIAAPAQTAGGPSVLVVGGTPAGVAAALAAARAGERVELVSASDDLGGTLSDAMMDQWDLNLTADGRSVQGGVFDEMYARLGDVFAPREAARTFAEMIAAEPGVTVRYRERPVAVGAVADGALRTIDAVTFAAPDGATVALHAAYVIDATDDGDVAALAGARYDVGRQDSGIDEREQAVTEMFTVAGVGWDRVASTYDIERDGPGGVLGRRAWGYATLVRDYRPYSANIVVRDLNLGVLDDGTVSVNAVDVTGIDGLDPRQLELAKHQTEIEAPRLVAFLRERLPGFERARVAAYATAVYVRETRHIAGLERLDTQDVWNGVIPADSIGLASYPIDVHPVDVTDEPAYAPVRHVYGIPFGALVPKGIANLLVASPAISASHLAAGSARTIPTTIEEGEADGAATALARSHGWTFAEMVTHPRRLATIAALTA